jgi:NPCBM/NEW2 domain
MRKSVIPNLKWHLSTISLALTIALISCNTTPKTADSSTNRKPWKSSNTNAAALNTGYLSDQDWISATSTWGPVSKNLAYGEGNPADRKKITLSGTQYDKGLGTHADSSVNFKLDPSCSSFKASLGIDDSVRWQSEHGNVLFQVYGDQNRLLFDSKAVDGRTPTKDIDVNVSGNSSLKLVVDQNRNATEGDQSDWYDQADWANARVECAGISTPPPSSPVPSTPTTGVLNTGFVSDQMNVSFNPQNGWGPIEVNMANGDDVNDTSGQYYNGHEPPLTLKTGAVAKGLGVHASSSVEFPLGGQCSSFNALVGLDQAYLDKAGHTVNFQVLVDGNVKRESGVLNKDSAPVNLKVDLTGGKVLKLVVTDGGDGNSYDHADWAEAKVACDGVSNPQPQPQPIPTGVEFKGVSNSMWAEIDARAAEFGDPHNCHAKFNAIPTSGLTISPSDGNAINNALGQSNTVILRGGTYRISSTLQLSGKKLVGAPGEVITINARDVRTAVSMGNNALLSNVRIIDAQNVGIETGNDGLMNQVSVARTGRSVTDSTNGRAFVGGVNNCLISTEARDSYNWLDYTGSLTNYPSTIHGGNGDGYVVSGSTVIDSYAYNNSDDGFDSWEGQPNYFYFSEAHDGSKNPMGFPDGGNGGDGNGFKLGRGSNVMYIYKSKAYNNKQSGFDANGNTAYPNFVIMCSESYGNGLGGVGQDWAQGLTGNTRSCP